MLSFLEGLVARKTEKYISLLVGPVGFRIFLTEKNLSALKPGDRLSLHIHLRHTDDSMSLYGFPNQAELDFFELLLTVNGVGPRHALGILNLARLEDIKKAVLKDDPSLLYKVSGIGKKTAERIVVELKSKLAAFAAVATIDPGDDSDSEAFDALATLGYKDTHIRAALKNIPENIKKMEDKVRLALKNLSQQK